MTVLRPYQVAACNAVLAEFAKGVKSTLICLPTGAGKTTCFANLAQHWLEGGYRVLVLAHRQELVFQAAATLGRFAGSHSVGVDMAAERVCDTPIVSASIQSLSSASRLQRYDRREKWVVVVDEAHRVAADSYRALLIHFGLHGKPSDWLDANPRSRLLGVTATPRRADRQALGQVFASCSFVYSAADAIREGWLVPVHQVAVHIDSVKFEKPSGAEANGLGEMSAAALAQQQDEERELHAVAFKTLEHADGQQSLVFAKSVEQSSLLAKIVSSDYGVRAAHIDGTTATDTRKGFIDAFRAGEINMLSSYDCLSEGFDAPTAAVCSLVSQTKSSSLYMQRVGRVMRALPGVVDDPKLLTAADRRAAIAASAKPRAIVLDFSCAMDELGVTDIVDALGGDECSLEVLDLARSLLKRDASADVVEALARAKAISKVQRVMKDFQAACHAADVLSRRYRIPAAEVHAVESAADPFGLLGLAEARRIEEARKAARNLAIRRSYAQRRDSRYH